MTNNCYQWKQNGLDLNYEKESIKNYLKTKRYER